MKKVFLFLTFMGLVAACSSSDDSSSEGDDYDRTALLASWADNIIVPSFENYNAKVQAMAADAAAFNAAPSEAGLQTLRASWLEAYKAYQYVSMYSIGKSEAIFFKEITNTYPTNAAGIESNIASGTYNLSLFSQYDKQGFPGLDYLLNGLGSDAATVGFFSTNANAANYRQYLTAVANKMTENATTILADWNSGYRDTYVNNNGTSVSSSLSRTVNNFVKHYEKDLRSGKIGIPAGIFSGGTLFPEKVEAYYKNDVSKILLNESVKATQNFFNGKYFGSETTGPGLKAYLDYLNTIRDGQKLSDRINNQFTVIYAANDAMSDSFSTQVNSDNSKMVNTYQALQQNVVYFKLDMMQALNLTIDYVDGDGD